MARIETLVLQPHSPELLPCATWRLQAFSGVLGGSIEAELASLQALVSDATEQVALVVKVDDVAAGTCLLVRSELEPQHAVSPWLAGLYVVPECRRRGLGTLLVRAIEDQARQRGRRQLYLYTSGAVAYYERLAWRVIDRIDWKGRATSLMLRELPSTDGPAA
uniref:GCN5-related N-acetyltransferase n=1 Tax=Rhodopseudomonas palustris (strain BisA53) TaxID=316055 RepID=Q07LB7_RHOP5